jgi:hypothetical protein
MFRRNISFTFRTYEQVKKETTSICCLLDDVFLLGLLFDLEDGGDATPKCRLTFTGLHGVISYQTEPFNTQDIPKSKKSLTSK